ncbi:E6 [Bos taurus papillomavirus 14]|uniref:Protein E6 n=1 Tax=Bos taurus papillomavirus 14 TaxID=2758381 RepID=A0A0E3SXR2_BPV1|nr:E6 [Bos taurus papillomavirus 14]ALL29330.1 E6 [Bos taurus papillomavirus 14]
MGISGYKSRTVIGPHNVQMDAQQIYAQLFENDNPFVGVCCLFCRNRLSSVDVHRAKEKELNVVRREGYKFGACTDCLEECLARERRLYKGTAVTGTEVEAQFSRKLCKIIIRCYYCGTKLSNDEKTRHELFMEPFFKTRNNIVRGRCYDCYRDGTRTRYPKESR